MYWISFQYVMNFFSVCDEFLFSMWWNSFYNMMDLLHQQDRFFPVCGFCDLPWRWWCCLFLSCHDFMQLSFDVITQNSSHDQKNSSLNQKKFISQSKEIRYSKERSSILEEKKFSTRRKEVQYSMERSSVIERKKFSTYHEIAGKKRTSHATI